MAAAGHAVALALPAAVGQAPEEWHDALTRGAAKAALADALPARARAAAAAWDEGARGWAALEKVCIKVLLHQGAAAPGPAAPGQEATCLQCAAQPGLSTVVLQPVPVKPGSQRQRPLAHTP